MMSGKFHVNRLAILGVGLIGGSLARALRQAGACGSIAGFGSTESNLKKAVRLGVIDDYAMQAAAVVRDADMIVMATPLSTYAGLFRELKAALGSNTTITDAGSVKGCVVETCAAVLDADQFRRFVPGHPIAGTEKSGVEASFASLFNNHLVILTPTAKQDAVHVGKVTAMWEAAGARVVTMPVDHHDQVLAATSHLPHMLAYALVDCLAGMQARDEIFRYAAGGFADFTRIASSSPRMWADICIANRSRLTTALDQFDGHMRTIKAAIAAGDGDKLVEIFARAKSARDEFISPKQ